MSTPLKTPKVYDFMQHPEVMADLGLSPLKVVATHKRRFKARDVLVSAGSPYIEGTSLRRVH